jgi:hypothetical protein
MAYGEWDVAVGEHLSREQRAQRFGGGKPGWIEPSASTPNVFLYSDPSHGDDYGYNFDGWSPDGTVFMHVGQGRRGDQVIRKGNLAILAHKLERNALRLFVADGLIPGTGAKNQLYIGQFEVDHAEPYVVERAADEAGEVRRVFVFRLRPVGPTLHRPQDDRAARQTVLRGSPPVDLRSVDRAPVTPTTMAPTRETMLVKRYRAMLAEHGHRVRRPKPWRPGGLARMRIDLYDVTAAELYEAKGSASPANIRMALGQLLHYEQHLPEPPKLRTVLIPTRPANDLVDLLHLHGVGCVWETDAGAFDRADPDVLPSQSCTASSAVPSDSSGRPP